MHNLYKNGNDSAAGRYARLLIVPIPGSATGATRRPSDPLFPLSTFSNKKATTLQRCPCFLLGGTEGLPSLWLCTGLGSRQAGKQASRQKKKDWLTALLGESEGSSSAMGRWPSIKSSCWLGNDSNPESFLFLCYPLLSGCLHLSLSPVFSHVKRLSHTKLSTIDVLAFRMRHTASADRSALLPTPNFGTALAFNQPSAYLSVCSASASQIRRQTSQPASASPAAVVYALGAPASIVLLQQFAPVCTLDCPGRAVYRHTSRRQPAINIIHHACAIDIHWQ